MPYRAVNERSIDLSALGSSDDERILTQIRRTIELSADLLEDMGLSETSISLRYALLQLRFEVGRQ